MSGHLRPPIPVTCGGRPLTGGLVIPWINVQLNVQLADGGVDFRAQHQTRTQRCYIEARCQVCGNIIEQPPFVFLGELQQTQKLQFPEPALHPECAVYVSRACPMVGGRMEQFASRDPLSAGRRGEVCPDPDCDCGGWVPTPGVEQSAGGRPVHSWYAIYASGYSLGVTADRMDQVHSAIVAPEQVLAIRHVSAPAVGRTWVRTSLEEVSADA